MGLKQVLVTMLLQAFSRIPRHSNSPSLEVFLHYSYHQVHSEYRSSFVSQHPFFLPMLHGQLYPTLAFTVNPRLLLSLTRKLV
ncbi:hypothetical protein Y1Q_0007958 [Alligator mississippiensis]|uniref:Uncharacterized protein n=1 Tax=Alligator mississippiensis TaxID=8496 RepID=A0A151NF43_ALLMI|nr:hypothetical protein Y1Q_0007958 [Alligator mississippiensis]